MSCREYDENGQTILFRDVHQIAYDLICLAISDDESRSTVETASIV